MPGKVNPVIPEAVCQVAAQVIGAAAGAANPTPPKTRKNTENPKESKNEISKNRRIGNPNFGTDSTVFSSFFEENCEFYRFFNENIEKNVPECFKKNRLRRLYYK